MGLRCTWRTCGSIPNAAKKCTVVGLKFTKKPDLNPIEFQVGSSQLTRKRNSRRDIRVRFLLPVPVGDRYVQNITHRIIATFYVNRPPLRGSSKYPRVLPSLQSLDAIAKTRQSLCPTVFSSGVTANLCRDTTRCRSASRRFGPTESLSIETKDT